MKRIFIDGGSGTVGLGIRDQLEDVDWATLVSLPDERRKDPAAKRALLAEVDAVVLCLPDAAAKETVALVDALGGRGPKVLDASTAHRVAPDWTYGFPELDAEQPAAIARSRRVANPGCYPTGAVALLRPLVESGLIPADHPICINAVSGYSGGGRSMIEAVESGRAPAFKLYGLGLSHKHLPEITRYARLQRDPVFVPSVGNYRQGMLVSIPLHLDALPERPSAGDLESALSRRYAETELVSVVAVGPDEPLELEPEALNGQNRMELRVYSNAERRQAVLVARLDNLAKGASGAAVQNLALMLSQSTSTQSA